MSIFTERLCRMVIERDISWSALAHRSNISSARMSQYKNGVYQPKLEGLYAIAKALDVNPFWLNGETDVLSSYSIKGKKEVDSFNKQLLSAYDYAPENIRKAIRLLLELDEKESDLICFSEMRGGA